VLLALRPRRSPGLWELVLVHKVAVDGVAWGARPCGGVTVGGRMVTQVSPP